MTLHEAYPPPGCTLHNLSQAERKPLYSEKHAYYILIEWNTELLSETLPFFYISYFLKLKRIPSLLQRQNYPNPESILYRSAAKGLLILLVWLWTTWTGRRKPDNFDGEFPSRNVNFTGIFQVNTR